MGCAIWVNPASGPYLVCIEAGLPLAFAKVTGGGPRFQWWCRRGPIPTRNGVPSASSKKGQRVFWNPPAARSAACTTPVRMKNASATAGFCSSGSSVCSQGPVNRHVKLTVNRCPNPVRDRSELTFPRSRPSRHQWHVAVTAGLEVGVA